MIEQSNDIYLSVVIPAYNEESRIIPTMERVVDYLDARPFRSEIIVVDDGSTDETVSRVALLKDNMATESGKTTIDILGDSINRGKGYAVKTGMLHARGKYLLFSDADLSTPIEEVEKLLAFVEGDFDIAFGSRSLPDSEVEVHQSFYREWMGKIFNKLVRLLTVRGFIDTQCGFKLFSAEAGKELFGKQKLDGFSFDVEILYLAQRKGYRMKEVPVRWINSPSTKVHAIRDSSRMLRDLFKIRLLHFKIA